MPNMLAPLSAASAAEDSSNSDLGEPFEAK